MNKYKLIFKRNLILMISLVLVIILGILLINNFSSPANNQITSLGGSFKLTDQDGKPFSSKNIRKKKLIYFGYTYCPDVCPFDVLKLSKYIDKNPDIENELEFIFITVDPERDNIEQVKDFLENFNPAIQGLTGTAKEIKQVIRQFRIYVKKNKASNEENYLIDHSSLFFLIDHNDNYITHFSPNDFKFKLKDFI
ncbi:MAG: SCO family protein [Alphaproteobacteria bacterium]